MSGPYQRPTAEDVKTVYGLDMSALDYEEFEQSYKSHNEYNRELSKIRNKNCGLNGLVLARASELLQPSGASHLLRQFGQGNRSNENCEKVCHSSSNSDTLQWVDDPRHAIRRVCDL